VSHAPERKEKDCLNCGATVAGRYCHICGQENIVPRESFGNLVLHFFYDITHFDGKFFPSLKYLLFRPGFLSKEFVNGRRASYLNPVRMYVFTSAIFFLIFFMIADPKDFVNRGHDVPLNNKERLKLLDDFEKEYRKSGADTAIILDQIEALKDTTKPVTLDILADIETSDTTQNGPKTFAEYDSIQKTLPSSERDGWLKRWAVQKFQFNEELRNDPSTALEKWTELFLHRLPYLLFLSLPIFALILKLLYVRRSKQFYYADHAIFSIHHYIFSFILLLFCFLLGTTYDITAWPVIRWALLIILLVVWPIHLYIAMRNFYQQRWFKTFLKFILLNILGFVSILILFTLFFLLSVFQA
jgi:hypothetical protein